MLRKIVGWAKNSIKMEEQGDFLGCKKYFFKTQKCLKISIEI